MFMLQFLATPGFVESLQKLDKVPQEHVKQQLKFFSQQDNPLPFAKKLRWYKDIFRFRVGNYRVIFRLQQKTIFLLLVRHRKDVYEGL